MTLPDPAVMVISDRKLARRPLEQVVEAAVQGGCRWFSLREKDLAPAARLRLLAQLSASTGRAGAVLTVHGDPSAAARADGLHLARDGDPAAARARLGPNALIGLSAHNLEEAERAQDAGADYVTLSPVFDSLSKPGYRERLGLEGLAAATKRLALPVIALGGISADSAAACRQAGAAGIALCGSIMAADDPAATLSRILKAFRS